MIPEVVMLGIAPYLVTVGSTCAMYHAYRKYFPDHPLTTAFTMVLVGLVPLLSAPLPITVPLHLLKIVLFSNICPSAENL